MLWLRVLLLFMWLGFTRVSNPTFWDFWVPSYKQAKEQIIKHKQRNQTRKKKARK